jgi:hypothetical protein
MVAVPCACPEICIEHNEQPSFGEANALRRIARRAQNYRLGAALPPLAAPRQPSEPDPSRQLFHRAVKVTYYTPLRV